MQCHAIGLSRAGNRPRNARLRLGAGQDSGLRDSGRFRGLPRNNLFTVTERAGAEAKKLLILR